MTKTTGFQPAGPTKMPWRFLGLAFLAVLFDGFDTASLAFSVPTLAEQWGRTPAAFGTALVLTNFGVVVGYIASGPLGARLGEKRLLISGIMVFGLFTVATALILSTESIVLLNVTRFLSGIGLGGVLPVAVSLAASSSPRNRREFVSVFVTLGLTCGLSLGGFLGGPLLRSVGTVGVFLIAGIAPIVVAIALSLVSIGGEVRQPVAAHAGRKGTETRAEEASVTKLFEREFRTRTLLLWCFSFLVFLVAYTISNWAPTLLGDYGFDEFQAPLGLAMFSLGGLLGGLILIPMAARLGITRSLIIMPTVGAIAMAGFAFANGNTFLVFTTLLVAGAGLTSSQIGQLTMAVTLYPEGTRSTGVGWSAALGRMGSIVGPGVGSVLLAASVSAQTIILWAIIPVGVAVFAAFVISSQIKSTRSISTSVDAAQPTSLKDGRQPDLKGVMD